MAIYIPGPSVLPKETKRYRLFLFLALVGLLGGFTGFFRIRTFDTFFHLATGRLILDAGTVPNTDPFSFSFPGAPWHNHSPLFQVAITLVHQLAGFVGLSFFQVILAMALSVGVVWSGVRAGSGVRSAVVLGLLPALIFRGVIIPRPHVFGYFFLQLGLLAIIHAERSRRTRVLFWVPILYGLWTLSHGSHPLFLAIVAFWLIGSWLTGNRFFAGALSAVLAGCIGLAFILMPDSLHLGTSHLGSGFLASEIPEWQMLTLGELFGTLSGILLVILSLLIVVGLVGQSRFGRQSDPQAAQFEIHHQLLLASFLVLSFTSSRMAPLFLFGAASLWLPRATWSAGKIGILIAGRISGSSSSGFAKSGVLDFLASFFVVLLVAGWLTLPSELQMGAGLARDRFPFAATEALALRGGCKRVYNAYNYGGFLLFHGYPERRVLIDGRAITVYPSAFLTEFTRAYTDFSKFERLASEYRTDCVLMPIRSKRTPPLLRYLDSSSRWRLAYSDPLAALFVLDRPTQTHEDNQKEKHKERNSGEHQSGRPAGGSE
ncbi:MAG: hypothetical protein GY847_24995 [Proteobacteria bacterium]|nr:hypothetical protein [Pseudomonadota bacterium]